MMLQINPDEAGFARFTAAFAEIPGLENFKGDFARAHFNTGFVYESDGRAQARVAVYTHPDLRLHEQSAASLGAWACCDDDRIARALLDTALQYVRNQLPEYKWVVGPMDGSTWENYRFALPAPEPPFVLEPVNPPWYPRQWEQNGFNLLKKYQSNQAELAADYRSDISEATAYFERNGLIFRNIDPSRIEDELTALADFNDAAFHDAFLITPISKSGFIDKYRKIVPLLKPELIWLAEHENRLCGMFFALPDYLDPARRTAVVKTLARLPDPQYKGLGEYLSARWVNSALDAGYTRMIHALMREDNASLRTSGRFWGQPFRTYQLYVQKNG